MNAKMRLLVEILMDESEREGNADFTISHHEDSEFAYTVTWTEADGNIGSLYAPKREAGEQR